MKKYIKYILLICFFSLTLNVNAFSKEELEDYFSKKEIKINSNDNICVYRTNQVEEISQYAYVIVLFEKNNEDSDNGYKLNGTHLLGGANDGSNVTIQYYKNENIKSNNCSDYMLYLNYYITFSSSNYSYIVYFKDNTEYDLDPDFIYEYHQGMTNILKEKITINEEDEDKEKCKFSVSAGLLGNKYVYINQFYDNDNGIYYTTDDGEILCPAEGIDDGYNFRRFSTTEFNEKTFVCDNWKLIEVNSFNDSGSGVCNYWLVDEKTKDIYASIDVEKAGDYITKYIAYQHSNAPYIKVLNSNSDIIYTFVNKQNNVTITVSGLTNNVKNTFLQKDKENYPKYIVYNNSNKTYRFSDIQGDSSETSYINIAHISSIVGLGTTKTFETCEDLLGTTFLDFLENNVVKLIYIAIPIILLVLTTIDFAKVVFIDDKEGIQTAGKKFGKRAIAAILIYLVPAILTFITRIFVTNEVSKCVDLFENSVASENEE